MNHGSLFSGIGGFDLAAQWMGWENVFHCEIDSFGQKILKHYWPNAISYKDITKTDFTVHRGRINVLTGGFPCQDASNALQTGSGQQGIEGERTGLFWQMLRATKEIKPDYLVAENVANILKTNKGRDFSTILTELSALGYNAEWRICRASEVGAPHHRARLYLVAYSDSIRIQRDQSFFSLLSQPTKAQRGKVTGTNVEINTGGAWMGKSPVYSLDDGISTGLDTIRKSIKALGNAIVPQVAYQIFKAIEQYNSEV